jgi:cell cycle sensor histidine kinase DivJ
VTVAARAEAAGLSFTVEDTGVGISDEDLVRVGEPYFQAGTSYERRHGGTGLGLSIVKGLVRLHGGEINIRSRVGEGTRVTVRLPLDCERDRPAQKKRAVVSVLPNAVLNPVTVRDVPSQRPNMPVKKSA